jgi:hypothetical protein
MIKYFTAIFLFFFLFSQSQINFEKGYLIDQKNVKKEGFIKNTESKKTPQVFE